MRVWRSSGCSRSGAEPADERCHRESDVGLVRTGDGLQNAVHGLTRVARRLRRGVSETDNLLTVAGLVTQAAFVRRESRGAHFRSDDVPTPGSRDEMSVGSG